MLYSFVRREDVKAKKDDIANAEWEVLDAVEAMLVAKHLTPTDRVKAATGALRAVLPVPRAQIAHDEGPPEDWDARVVAWANVCEVVTLDRALRHFKVEIGSEAQTMISDALQRLPKTRFAVSWYPATGGSLAPKWTRV
jgi:hypothetical protein